MSASTKASRARTERPVLPRLPAELTARERLNPLTGQGGGVLVTIDRKELEEIYIRLAEAVAAVERGNTRAGGVERWWTCTDAIWRTGKASADCAAR